MDSVFYYDYPIGKLGIAESKGAIRGVFFSGPAFDRVNKKMTALAAETAVSETALIKKAAGQLDEYFKGKRKTFDLPLAPEGTDFQKQVWEGLLGVPFGQCCTYKGIALSIGRPKASRAVGMAANRNPIVIIIPCHRMLGSNGSLTGFAGGLPVKQQLLDLERQYA